jgi:acetylornithine/succinyldiaminopimelate/putrescine aminotransferase
MISNRQLFLRYLAQTSDTSLQFEIDRAEGIFFYDRTGKPYIDLVSGVSVSALGHGHPAVIDAVKGQADRYLHTMVYGEFVQSPQVEYAQWLVDKLPGSLDNVYFVNSGSEAIDGAMKLAKRHTGRGEFRAFKNGYHGGTHGAFSLLGNEQMRSGYYPLLPGIKHLRFNDHEDLSMIDEHVAAVVMEPIQAEAGIIEPEGDFLRKVRDRCDQTGTLMVLDEIQTGMGRTGKWFCFEHEEVVPDILCLAKSFGGGMPLGAFVASREVMHQLAHHPALGHITTFGGHPVSCAAGLAAQRYIDEHGLLAHASKMGRRFRNGLKHPLIRQVRGKGLFLAVVLDRGLDVGRFINRAFENGLVIDRFLFSDDAFRIAPPLIISSDEVDDSTQRILATLDWMMK